MVHKVEVTLFLQQAHHRAALVAQFLYHQAKVKQHLPADKFYFSQVKELQKVEPVEVLPLPLQTQVPSVPVVL
jgi:hypothetical protein